VAPRKIGTRKNGPYKAVPNKIGVSMMTTKKPAAVAGKIHLKWVISAICAPVKQKRVIKGLGFTRLNQVIERPDNPAIRGMVAKVPHMVEILK
jgi:large subunit ribosomal protein L30